MRIILSAALVIALVGCGVLSKKDNNDGGDSLIQQDNLGCVQGVVLDGISKQRVALRDGNREEGVQVLVRNKLISAKTLVDGTDEDAQENLKGEYYVCGIPLETTLPIFVWKNGYQSFEGLIKIPATVSQKTPQSQVSDLTLTHPTLIADIHIYPKATEALDLKFNVYFGAERVSGAQVQLKPLGSNIIDTQAANETYIVNPQIRLTPITKTTDKNGQVTYDGKELVLGGNYQYTIIPAPGNDQMGITKGQITVGFNKKGTNLTNKPFEVHAAIERVQTLLALESSSLDNANFNKEGKIVLVFNQNIELTPASANSYLGQLVGNSSTSGGAVLEHDGSKDAVSLNITGSTLTLTPKNWLTRPSFDNQPDLQISYENIVVQPAGSQLSGDELSLDGKLQVRFFKQ